MQPSIVAVLPAKVFNRCKPELMHAFLAPGARPTPRTGCTPSDIATALGERPGLSGAGDVVLLLKGWTEPPQDTRPTVRLNGADVSEAIKVIGTEYAPDRSLVALTLRLEPHAQSRALWSNLIRGAGLSTQVPLSVQFGQGTDASSFMLSVPTIAIDKMGRYTTTIAVTVEWRLWLAAGLMALFGGGAVTLALALHVLKDRPPTAIAGALAEASRLKQSWKRHGRDLAPCLAHYYNAFQPNKPGQPGHVPCMPENIDLACLESARKALESGTLPADVRPVIVGLIQGRTAWSYSLAATQLFLWFLFALLSGIYFWAIHGQMPAIDNSILGLLGISSGTAAVSWIVDRSALTLPGAPSLGFFQDLVTDSSNEGRIHRFQCVFVNGALLLVGISNIVLDMEYPTFDPSWLMFLSISGVTYTVGKKIVQP